MKTPRLILSILFSTCLLLAACSDQPVDPATSDNVEPNLNVEESNFKLDKLAPSKADLQKLFESAKAKRYHRGGIAKYQFDVRLGSGPYDVVRIHRVVKERKPFRPVRSRGSVFMVHGTSQGFTDIFLNAGTEQPDPETSVAFYLASQGIDVWGIDLAWNFVPEEETEFAFMKDWGLEKDVKHTLAAMSVARFFRLITGQGLSRMHLLGYSYGATIAYTAAGIETRQHYWKRDIKGLIAVDAAFKLDNVKLRQQACNAAANFRAQWGDGIYENDASGFSLLGNLAIKDPDGTSPVNPNFKNYQLPLVMAITPRRGSGWHFLAGKFDPKNPANLELYHTKPIRWYRLLQSLPPYMPKLISVNTAETRCGNKDVPFDDHLQDISVPILYVGAIGAEGEEGYYTTTLTSSKDITTFTVEAPIPGKEDYGHADLFLAENAPDLVWSRLQKWIKERDRSRRYMAAGR